MSLIAVPVAGCASRPAPTPPDAWCLMNAPRYPSPEVFAVMSNGEKADLVVHNETGERLCGWKPAT